MLSMLVCVCVCTTLGINSSRSSPSSIIHQVVILACLRQVAGLVQMSQSNGYVSVGLGFGTFVDHQHGRMLAALITITEVELLFPPLQRPTNPGPAVNMCEGHGDVIFGFRQVAHFTQCTAIYKVRPILTGSSHARTRRDASGLTWQDCGSLHHCRWKCLKPRK